MMTCWCYLVPATRALSAMHLSIRHCVAAVEQHRSNSDNSSVFHSQRGSKILLVAACALIRGDKVLCAQRPAGKRRGGEPWLSCMAGQL